MNSHQLKWDLRFLRLAKEVSAWSKDPSTQVGAVIVDDMNRVVSLGFNGLPRMVKDSQDRLRDRDLKLKLTLHAEENAILFAQRDLNRCTIYVWPMAPCATCASRIIQSRIRFVVAGPRTPERWTQDRALALQLLKESYTGFRELDLDKERYV